MGIPVPEEINGSPDQCPPEICYVGYIDDCDERCEDHCTAFEAPCGERDCLAGEGTCEYNHVLWPGPPADKTWQCVPEGGAPLFPPGHCWCFMVYFDDNCA